MPGIQELTLRQLKQALEAAADNGYRLFPESREAGAWTSHSRSPLFSALWQDIRERGERAASEPVHTLPFSDFIRFGTTGDRQAYETSYFGRRTRLSVLTLLALAEGKERWITALENTLWAICEESTWVVPAHVGLYVNRYPDGIWDQPSMPRETVDLFSAITAFTLAEIVGLLEHSLHPWVVERVRQELDRRIMQVYFHDPVPQDWEMKTNNWPAVCAAGIGVAAIYEEKDSARLAGMLWRIIEAMRKHLSGFDDEGATSEGVVYWQFGFGFFVYFSELLKERTNGAIDLLDDERIGRIAQFPNSCLLSGGKVVNFSDSMEDAPFNLGLFSRLNRKFPAVAVPDGEPSFNQLFHYWPNVSRILLWTAAPRETSAAVGGSNEAEASTGTAYVDRFFEGHQWVIAKSFTSQGLQAFAAKGGHNAEPHNHNDLGHFILHAGGRTVLADLGAGFYTKEYFQRESRYETLNAGSHGHSVPIVDGCRQEAGPSFRARVLQYTATEGSVTYELDLTEAYECANLTRLTRAFHWQRPQRGECEAVLTVQDSVRFAERPGSYAETFVSVVEPLLVKPGRVKLDRTEMRYDERKYAFKIDVRTVLTHQGEERTIYLILLEAIDPELQFECTVEFRIHS